MSFRIDYCFEDSVLVYDGGRCFRTIDQYNHLETCSIYVVEDCKLDVKRFEIESDQDYLYYNSYTWTGTNGPDNFMEVTSGNAFVFTSDFMMSNPGFDICCFSTNTPSSTADNSSPTSDTLSPTSDTLSPPFDTTSPRPDEGYELRGGDTMKGNLYLNGQPICDSGWDDADADVVCRKMGFDYGSAVCCSMFGQVDGNFTLTNVDCEGDEFTIWDCPSTNTVFCQYDQAAGVECFYYVLEEWREQWRELEYIWLSAIILGTFFMLYCCQRCVITNYQVQQRNMQGGIQIEAASEPHAEIDRIHSFAAIPNGVYIEREGAPTNTHEVIHPERDSYRLTSTNTFQGYARPKFDSSADEQVEGVSSRDGNVTTYENSHGASDEADHLGPVTPEYGVSTPAGPPPPAWAPPPPYAKS